jgi:hypothetical protein
MNNTSSSTDQTRAVDDEEYPRQNSLDRPTRGERVCGRPTPAGTGVGGIISATGGAAWSYTGPYGGGGVPDPQGDARDTRQRHDADQPSHDGRQSAHGGGACAA